MRSQIRPYLLVLHRWTGLCAGLLFLLVALTGAAMAYRAQLESVVDPDLLTAPACAAPLPLDMLVAQARAASPRVGALKLVRLYADPATTARIRFDDGRWVYVDRCSGRVAGKQVLYGGFFGTLGWLHIFGFASGHDWVAGGVATLFALAMLAAGIALWWPATLRAVRAGSRLTPGLRGRAFSLDLHRTVAFYAAPVLLTSALTGLPQAFQWGQAPAPPPMPMAVADSHAAPLQRMWEQAQLQVPAPQKTQIRFAPGAAVTFEMVAQTAPHANALSYVYIDPQAAQVIGYVPHASNRMAHQAYLFAAALHYGWIGGVAGQLLLMMGALAVPLLAWTGTASYLRGRHAPPAARLRVVVAGKTVEARDVCSFELVAADGQPLPPFSAGAHIDVHLPGGLVRQYSLCNDPRETRRYLIAVMHTGDSRGGSSAMHQMVNVGDRIEIGVPRNHFPLAPAAARSLLLAGGIGITPIICMAERLAAAGADFTLHYCARSPQRAAFAKRIAQSGYADRVTFHYSEGAQQQRVNLRTLLAAPDGHTHLYVCGPTGFMDAAVVAALALGWSEDQVHREYFAAAPPDRSGDTAFDIRIASSGAIIHVARDVTALQALTANGIVVPSSCEQGVCGSCVTPVADGEPDHRDLFLNVAQHARNDQFTPCCSRSRSPVLTLDL